MNISREQALDCLRSNDLIGIGMEADAVRRRLHPEGVVTYAIEVGDELASDADDRGASGLVLRGGRPLEELEARLEGVRTRFPRLTVGGLTATDVLRAGPEIGETLRRLSAAGLSWLGGWDAQVLDEGFRQGACCVADWLRIHRAAHAVGIPTMATMTFGQGETHAQRITHLELISALQAESGGFRAFTPATFRHSSPVDDATSVEYLKVLATCRIVLETIPHMQAYWPAQGVKVLQMGLRFGASDAGTAAQEPGTSEEDLRRMIRDAGFRPAQRDSCFKMIFLE